ncbi:sodium/bile acid cotransporter-like isoform X2 [Pararge aegeria]|nr:sodium/bile acid cotransporter-like isoform X2 [Pararge aegeria]XP_039760623.1 sodium/bile acid cotransporter-like isoform X2 [Pararge aegeria]
MCPLWPMHLIILYLLMLCPLWVLCQAAPEFLASFTADTFEMHMDDSYFVYVNITGNDLQLEDKFQVRTEIPHVATASWNSTYDITDAELDKGHFYGRIKVDCKFLGRTDMTVEASRGGAVHPVTNGTVPIVVIRPVRVIDTVFTTSVAVFVSLIFINFGCAMHWPTVTACLKKPIGPAIGLAGQYLFMPLISFGLGFLIFPDSPALRLGMFFSGVSPAGGASNIWTFILGGNLDLSLAMTSISTLAAFGLMPAWLFSLGQVVFANANIVVPYLRIGMFVIGLFIPLAIGLAMQRFTPRISAFMVRILKGFSTLLLLFIITFAIVTNLYIFELMTWQILVAGMGVPWLGYLAGYSVARLFRQPHRDALAISIESGIQNTGIAIFLLRYALPQPEADITTVVPVSIAIMTPGPMICIFIYQRIKACWGCKPSKIETQTARKSWETSHQYQRPLSPASSLPLMSNKQEENWSSSS